MDVAGLLLALLGVILLPRGCKSLAEEAYHHLDASLHYFETLHPHHLKHTVTATGLNSHQRQIEFHTLGRDFHLHLKPHRSLFARDFAAYTIGKDGQRQRSDVDLDEYYHGYVHGEEISAVTAHVSKDGLLSAFIKIHTELFHIEPSDRFITEPHPLHMVAYRTSDVKDNITSLKVDYVTGPREDELSEGDDSLLYKSDASSRGHSHLSHLRMRRQGALRGDSCNVVLVADYRYYNKFKPESSVIRNIVSLVSAIDASIYRPTEWIIDVDGNTITGLGLEIGEILVHTTPNDTSFTDAPTVWYNSQQLAGGNPDATDLLSAFNYGGWEDACLAHLFTYRDFQSGLLGLANIASPRSGQTGGICSRPFTEQRTRARIIYNTGISTFVSGDRPIIMEEARLVTGHELGHNWGSHHDPSTDECASRFLMNEFAQDGSSASHSQFSPCSRRSIGVVIRSKGGCFMDRTTVCGDYLAEVGEACDAGPNGDNCCNNDCTLRPSAACSDANHACCSNCTISPNTSICLDVGDLTLDCTADVFCDGISETCPNMTVEGNVGDACIGGECQLDTNGTLVCMDICAVRGLGSCDCPVESECAVCCNMTGACVPEQRDNETIFVSNGVPCSVGACFDGECVEGQDVITRFFDIISSLDVNAFVEFVFENIVGFVLIFTTLVWVPGGILIHCCLDRPLKKRFGDEDYIDWFRRRFWDALPFVSRDEEPHGTEAKPLIPEDTGPSPTSVVPPVDPVDYQPLPAGYSGQPISTTRSPLV